ncbi:replicative DNA helicase [Nostoc sphaeroides]|uniref:Replicative DNA helicase n=1 Tax=Nostoc sphaeroides CCNUC1 TaxID=2653204 RepID=A0A5P8WLU8_9NOSO|nr:replicative DNA helicase [Nostoc sphaeroides]QFS52879.1 dnaB, replicative DNA helicase [Nostoc sphaeroides CCNUC1]
MTQQLDFADVNDQLPPQNIEAEEAILGGIMLDPDATQMLADTLVAEAFYIQAHRDIYQAALQLSLQHKHIDLLTVTSWLSDNDLLVRVGGRNKLANLVDRTVSAVNIDGLAEMVMDKYHARKLISAANQILKLAYDESVPLAERLDAAQEKIFSIRHETQTDKSVRMNRDISVINFAEIERISQGEQEPGISSGFYDLDTLTAGGFHPGELIIVGGRPSMGKSSFAHQLAFSIAKEYSAPTMIFSLEMSGEEINKRFLSSESGIEMSFLKSGKLSNNQWESLAQAVGDMDKVPLIIDDSTGSTPLQIRSKLRKAIAQHGQVKLVVIDYLQLMVDSSSNRLTQMIGHVTRELKLLARECNVPIMLLSQLNRGVEDRNDKRPMLSDLRDSGRIEEDADIVLAVYRDEYYNSESPDRGIAEVSILKNRQGATGTIKLLFEPHFTRFKNLKR